MCGFRLGFPRRPPRSSPVHAGLPAVAYPMIPTATRALSSLAARFWSSTTGTPVAQPRDPQSLSRRGCTRPGPRPRSPHPRERCMARPAQGAFRRQRPFKGRLRYSSFAAAARILMPLRSTALLCAVSLDPRSLHRTIASGASLDQASPANFCNQLVNA